ncbi:MAG TPA: hypothetical protein VII21_04755 [Aestuariivirga sp.]
MDANNYFILEKHAVVCFSMEEIVDLQLSEFSSQNVIDGLELRYGQQDLEREPYYTPNHESDAYQLALSPCYGLYGFIRCKKLSVTFKPGKPER